MSRKVLIIGSKGMLGQELVRTFSADKNYEVFGWDKSNIRLSDSMIFEEIDITDEARVKEKIGALAPQIIINAAAYNDVDKCEEPAEFELAKALNGLAPGYLAEVAKEIKIPPNPPFTKWGKGAIFVHFSTDYVFDGEKKEGYLESDKPSPISNYGKSKLMGEQEVARIGGQYYIIRLQKLFGRPAFSAGAKKSFFEVMLELAKTKKELEIVDEELANFTYAPDLAERTKWLVEAADLRGGEIPRIYAEINPPTSLSIRGANAGKYPYGIYHITNEGAPATWFGAAKVLFEMTQQRHPERSEGSTDSSATSQNDNTLKLIPVPASHFPRPARRPKYSILLNIKLSPLRSWPEALREFLEK